MFTRISMGWVGEKRCAGCVTRKCFAFWSITDLDHNQNSFLNGTRNSTKLNLINHHVTQPVNIALITRKAIENQVVKNEIILSNASDVFDIINSPPKCVYTAIKLHNASREHGAINELWIPFRLTNVDDSFVFWFEKFRRDVTQE